MTLERTQGARGSVTVAGQSIYEFSSTQLHDFGARLQLGERVFHYGLIGASTILPGVVATGAIATHNEQTVTVAHPIGSYKVDVTLASVVAGQLAGGTLIVTAGTAIGESYAVRDNDATGGAAGSGKVRITLWDPLATAWATADTDVSVYESLYYKVVAGIADRLDKPVGVPVTSATAAYYGWLQTWGPCGVIVDTATAAGAEADEGVLVMSTNHAGNVMAVASGVIGGMAAIGTQMLFTDHTDTEAVPVYLQLAP